MARPGGGRGPGLSFASARQAAFPFASGGPLIAMLPLGRFVYRDTVSPTGCAASGVGLAGRVLLSLC